SKVLAGGERGLLSIAFHPDYPSRPWVYVYYTRRPDGAVVISRFTLSVSPDRLDVSSEAILLVQEEPFSNHNGGQLQFGPDGLLYAGLGDGGSANDPQCFAQRSDSLLGKMLRLDVDASSGSAPFYGIPAGNPFAGPGDPPDEVWASGLRNPWRFSFDSATGDLWIADVGQSDFEEVNVEPAGSSGGLNWGWKYKEGNACVSTGSGCPETGLLADGCDDPDLSDPVIVYDHSTGDCSITGGYVYRGSAIPGLVGDYLFGDYCSGRIRRASGGPSNPTVVSTGLVLPELSSFGEDADGELWVTSLNGTLARLVASGQAEPGTVQLAVTEVSFSETAGVVEIAVERTGGSTGFAAVRVQVVSPSPGANPATEGADFRLLTELVEWGDGEEGARTIRVELIDDGELEQDETFALRISLAAGDVALGAAREVVVAVLDDERRRVGGCEPDADTLCLNDGRFRVEMTFADFEGQSGVGQADPLTDDTGSFWFFDAANVEVVIKVLDACAISDRYWVFAAGLTNVATRIEVVDTVAGELRIYENALGEAFAPVLDTGAFATCP
ncbi:MAG TPA: PQQ-dependent sugar dehydrogenase, partial [Thermoanaerobaculia bacterium]|nr:PQQ-dependent sugar dehydrogenase [Thermoanaerobaculia bacterium]